MVCVSSCSSSIHRFMFCVSRLAICFCFPVVFRCSCLFVFVVVSGCSVLLVDAGRWLAVLGFLCLGLGFPVGGYVCLGRCVQLAVFGFGLMCLNFLRFAFYINIWVVR